MSWYRIRTNRTTFISLDSDKAFDTIYWRFIFATSIHCGLPPEFPNLIKILYELLKPELGP
uniref:Reverse transcriptase n=1 Tax=Varanus komodoensis TaxID=61221 RepID=A0A8D2M024_VARKO